jgi:hypothetical protein
MKISVVLMKRDTAQEKAPPEILSLKKNVKPIGGLRIL